jgi:hypothetical protein
MAFQLSPGVLVVEKDLTNVVPAVATSIGANVGEFVWGPVLDPITISSELELVKTFGKPNDTTAASFFSAANFLSYSNNLKVVRVVGTSARNAVATGTAVLIKNETNWDSSYANGQGTVGEFAAKYPGSVGNSLKVSMCDFGTFNKALTGTVTITLGGTSVAGSGTAFNTEVAVGSVITTTAGVVIGTVVSVASATTMTITPAAVAVTVGGSIKAVWEYADQFDSAPGTSDFCENIGATIARDELHIVVVDEEGVLSGTPGTILEKWVGLSKASNAKTTQGANNYYKDVLQGSQYVWWMDHTALVGANDAWGSAVISSTIYKLLTSVVSVSLSGGVDATPATGDIQAGWDLFTNAELIDVNLLVTGPWGLSVSKYIVENVAEVRRDCVAFCSPSLASVYNNVGDEADDIVAERIAGSFNVNSSYGVLDSGWKYQYDKYNDKYRWVPLNPDVAGLCARTDNIADPWFSPGGLNRGQIKNVVKLAYSPDKTDRDTLYKNGVNPVVSFPGEGTILFGDKTLLAKPSAFDRINVRRLFIVLEKAIALAAKYQLFEFNDAFTRAQFRNLVEPFLRDVQGRRGIFDFRVICDETNNTGEIIDRNEFVADIYIKPARSINFMTLNFIATRTGVSFNEIVGA